jgi:hypothetical protein
LQAIKVHRNEKQNQEENDARRQLIKEHPPLPREKWVS